MALTEVNVSKRGSTRPILTLVRGDNRTHAICMMVDRYYGGVDLSGLAWSVVARRADGNTDVFYPGKARISDDTVTVDWIVHGTSTMVAGITEFELEGIAKEGDSTYIWQSGTYKINITEDIDHTPGEEEKDQLTEVQTLIAYADKELPGVIQAGKDAKAAAESVPAAVEMAAASLTWKVDEDGYLVVERRG